MDRHITLNNGRQMPILGLGTWKSEAGQVGEAVKCAIDAGYRLIDCAYIYGNEAEVGAALRDRLDRGSVTREELFISSKLWNTRHATKDVRRSCLETLDLLGLEYLDLYLIHWPMAYEGGCGLFPKGKDGGMLYSDIHYLETWKAMEELVDEGLVRSIGLSNFNSAQVKDVVYICRIKPVLNQVEVHPYLSQADLSEFCAKHDIAIEAYSPFASPDRPWAPVGEVPLLEDPTIKNVADKYGKTPAKVVLRWLIQRGMIVIPKSVTPSRIQSNLDVFDFELTGEDMKLMSSLNRNQRVLVVMKECEGKLVARDRQAPNYPFDIPF